jgi:hypothetical protein
MGGIALSAGEHEMNTIQAVREQIPYSNPSGRIAADCGLVAATFGELL